MSNDSRIETDETIDAAQERLLSVLRGYGRVAVALSGGVDSSVVAKAAQLACGDAAVAITGRSASVPQAELELAAQIAKQIGIRHVVVDTNEFEDPNYVRNDGTRCYYCKSELYDRAGQLKQKLDFDVICSGANLDDASDYRPGLTAAEERHVRHPLQEAAFTKDMVRTAAKEWGLPNWNKPAAPCLSSRIAVGVEATPERTRRVELAEQFLREQGFRELRVRCHAGELARIEVPSDQISRFADGELSARVAAKLKELGFLFVSLDLEGFRSGGLNVLVPTDMLTLSAKK